jgi:hypothetical protein
VIQPRRSRTEKIYIGLSKRTRLIGPRRCHGDAGWPKLLEATLSLLPPISVASSVSLSARLPKNFSTTLIYLSTFITARTNMPPRSILPSSSQVAAPIPSSQMAETSQPAKKLKKYRPVKPLPYELRDIINVYIEEQLCKSLPMTVILDSFLTSFSLTSSSVTLKHTHRRH